MLVDTHAHINFNAFRDDADEVISRSLLNDIWLINVGSQYSTSKRAVEIAERYEEGVYPHTKQEQGAGSAQINEVSSRYGVGVYAAIGLHPIHLSGGIFKTKVDTEEIEFVTKEEEFDYDMYKKLAQSRKVVAIGEIGLDYWYRPKTKIKLEQFKEKQKEVFLRQFQLARELKLPVILHCRMAHDDLIECLQNLLNFSVMTEKFRVEANMGVVHCFTGTWEQAQRYMEMGFYIGLNGIIFKLDLNETIKKIPLERILVETDCPYLTPMPMIGRNEPVYVKYIVQKIAELKSIDFNEAARQTTKNAKDLFRI